MKIKKYTVWLILLILTLIMMESHACADESLEEMRAAAAKIDSVSGPFIQEKQMPILARPLIARGYFAYQRPASLRWEYQAPLQRVLLMHNGDVHQYLHADKGWVEDKAANMQSMDFILREISKWLNGRFEDNPMFKVSSVSGKQIVMLPKDKSMDGFIQRIELEMAEQAGIIKAVTIFENEDSFTRFSFIDPRINKPLAPATFQKVP